MISLIKNIETPPKIQKCVRKAIGEKFFVSNLIGLLNARYSDIIMGAMASQITSRTIFLLNRLFRRRSKNTWKLRVTGFGVGNSPVTGELPAQMVSNVENVSMTVNIT